MLRTVNDATGVVEQQGSVDTPVKNVSTAASNKIAECRWMSPPLRFGFD